MQKKIKNLLSTTLAMSMILQSFAISPVDIKAESKKPEVIGEVNSEMGCTIGVIEEPSDTTITIDYDDTGLTNDDISKITCDYEANGEKTEYDLDFTSCTDFNTIIFNFYTDELDEYMKSQVEEKTTVQSGYFSENDNGDFLKKAKYHYVGNQKNDNDCRYYRNIFSYTEDGDGDYNIEFEEDEDGEYKKGNAGAYEVNDGGNYEVKYVGDGNGNYEYSNKYVGQFCYYEYVGEGNGNYIFEQVENKKGNYELYQNDHYYYAGSKGDYNPKETYVGKGNGNYKKGYSLLSYNSGNYTKDIYYEYVGEGNGNYKIKDSDYNKISINENNEYREYYSRTCFYEYIYTRDNESYSDYKTKILTNNKEKIQSIKDVLTDMKFTVNIIYTDGTIISKPLNLVIGKKYKKDMTAESCVIKLADANTITNEDFYKLNNAICYKAEDVDNQTRFYVDIDSDDNIVLPIDGLTNSTLTKLSIGDNIVYKNNQAITLKDKYDSEEEYFNDYYSFNSYAERSTDDKYFCNTYDYEGLITAISDHTREGNVLKYLDIDGKCIDASEYIKNNITNLQDLVEMCQNTHYAKVQFFYLYISGEEDNIDIVKQEFEENDIPVIYPYTTRFNSIFNDYNMDKYNLAKEICEKNGVYISLESDIDETKMGVAEETVSETLNLQKITKEEWNLAISASTYSYNDEDDFVNENTKKGKRNNMIEDSDIENMKSSYVDNKIIIPTKSLNVQKGNTYNITPQIVSAFLQLRFDTTNYSKDDIFQMLQSKYKNIVYKNGELITNFLKLQKVQKRYDKLGIPIIYTEYKYGELVFASKPSKVKDLTFDQSTNSVSWTKPQDEGLGEDGKTDDVIYIKNYTVNAYNNKDEKIYTTTLKDATAVLPSNVNAAYIEVIATNEIGDSDAETLTLDAKNLQASVSVTTDKENYYPTDTIHYSVVVTNTGDTDLTNVNVTESLNGKFVDLADGITSPKANTAVIASLPVSASSILYYDVKVSDVRDKENELTNITTMTASDIINEEVTNTVILYSPSLSVTKTSDKKSFIHGDEENVTYKIDVTNTGDCDLHNVTVTEEMEGTFKDDENIKIENNVAVLSELKIGQTYSFYYVVNADNAVKDKEYLSNHVTVKADECEGEASSDPVTGIRPTTVPTQAPTQEPTKAPTAAPTQIPTVEPTQAPTTEPTVKPTVKPTTEPTVEPTVIPTVKPTIKPTEAPTHPSMEVTKTADKKSCTYGKDEKITYTIKVKNTGDCDLHNIVVTEEMTGAFKKDTNVTIKKNTATIDILKPGKTYTLYYIVDVDKVAKSKKALKNHVTAVADECEAEATSISIDIVRSSANPKTGDDTPVGGWLAMFFVSAIGIVGFGLSRKKKQN